jgi:hypothetical protein
LHRPLIRLPGAADLRRKVTPNLRNIGWRHVWRVFAMGGSDAVWRIDIVAVPGTGRAMSDPVHVVDDLAGMVIDGRLNRLISVVDVDVDQPA